MAWSDGEAKLRLIVGLGNPGDRYRDTRHNLGFKVLDRLVGTGDFATPRLECNALVSAGPSLQLAWPQTYMNRSGFAVRCLAERYELQSQEILIVYDDVALPLATLRLRTSGGPGGHRGMESVIQNLQTAEIPRLRLGIAPEVGFSNDEELSEFVLAPFANEESDIVGRTIERAAEACECWLRDGSEMAMSRYNGSCR